MERPKKDAGDADEPIEVLTDVFHVPADVEKFASYGEKRFSGDYGIPGATVHINMSSVFVLNHLSLRLRNSSSTVPLRCGRRRRRGTVLWRAAAVHAAAAHRRR